MSRRFSRTAVTSARLTVILWCAVVAFVFPAAVFTGQIATVHEVLTFTMSTGSAGGWSAVLYLLFRRAGGLPGPGRAVAISLAVAAIAVLQTATDFSCQYGMHALFPDVKPPPFDARTLLLTTLIYLCVYACNAAIYWVVQAAQQARESELQLANAGARAARAELERLRLQLNPHFMCNALNAVSSLIAAGRYGEATTTTEKLADFLRSSLRDHDGDIPLADEIDTVGAYLDVESVRFGDRLVIDIDMADEVQGAPVPPFILQPLVENVMKHAVAPSRSPVRLTISALREDHQLVLQVLNDGVAAQPARSASAPSGIGLKNTRARLNMRYGHNAGLSAGPVDGGFRSVIRLPVEA